MGEQNVPISVFKLKTDDFTRYGRPIGALGLSTLFVLEGGYAVNVLQEFA
jgi:acetoin utilization deacetylase AcuC-like enzyme